MAANNAASLAEEMSRFEEEISGSGPRTSLPPPIVAPQTSGMPTQAMPTGPPPGLPPPFMMPPGAGPPPPPGMTMPRGPMLGPISDPVPPPGVQPMGAMPPMQAMPPMGMPPPGLPMPGMPPPMMPPMGAPGPFMMPVPMPTPTMVPVAVAASGGAMVAAGGMPPDTLSDEQKKEWESQFSKGAATTADKKKKKKNLRTAAGVTWVDNTLEEWDETDFRIFAGDLGHECTDEVLFRAFSKYPSLKKCKVVRDNRTNKSRGFGFVSFKDPKDFLSAMKEMNGKYVAGRPIKLRKSTWKDRQLTNARKKQREKERLGLK